MEHGTVVKKHLIAEIAEIENFMEQFAQLLKAETQALRATKFEDAARLQPQKQEMARQYQKRIQKLVDCRDEIATLPEDVKTHLVASRLQFSEVLAENLRVIEAARKTGRRLAEKIIAAARDSISKKTGYNAAGKMSATADPHKAPVSIRLNDTF